MKIRKSLQPVALALPGLLVTTVQAGFQSYDYNPKPPNSTWQGTANPSSGYTAAAYSGGAADLYGRNIGWDTSISGCVTVQSHWFYGVTAATMSYTWSSNSYSVGHSILQDTQGYNAEGLVWNTPPGKQC